MKKLSIPLSIVILLVIVSCGDSNKEKIKLALNEVQLTYLNELDRWVAEGIPPDQIQSIAETCGKLALATASDYEKPTDLARDREEFDFRVDACVKLTAHRVSPQPEFENPKIVEAVCGDSVELFNILCERAHLP